MGIYLFSLRARTHKISLPDGTSAVANEIRFLFNGGSFYTPRAGDRLLQNRAERYWEGKTLPKYVVMVSKEGPEKCARVYEWTGKSPFWVDCDKFPGEQIGEVREILKGGTLRVGPHVHETTPGYYSLITGQDLCDCGEAMGPERPERTSAYQERIEAEKRDLIAREDLARQNWTSTIME